MTPEIFIVMAVFRPDPDHLRAQMQSFADQSLKPARLVAVIADTMSGALVAGLADDLGLAVTLVVPDFELDAVRAFETGIAETLALIDGQDRDATSPEPLIALSDQDDLWHPDRLAAGADVLARGKAGLVHSDMRLVDADGAELHPSVFAFEKRHRAPGLRGLLYRNNITGMTLLMRADIARIALPFPAQSGVHFYHDLWLGLVAEASGQGVALIRKPLVDYRQHGGNEIGAVDRRKTGPRKRRRPDAMWIRREAAAYALARYLAHATHHRMVEAVADGRIVAGTARLAPLRPFLRRRSGARFLLWDTLKLGLTGHVGLARIAAGFSVVSLGRSVWALRHSFSDGLRTALGQFDARLYSMSPGVAPKEPELDDRAARKPEDYQSFTDTRVVPRWTPEFDADTPALTVLVPTLNPTEIFAGIVTALDIGLGLAARGASVRFIATDLPVSSPGASRSFLLRRLTHAQAATGAANRVSIHCGVQNATLPAHEGDHFLATAWWSAHVADKLIRHHGFAQDRFHYLIQDYEPNFYAWGPDYAGATDSYGLNFTPIFNTTLLRDYFAERGFDFATPDTLAFHPAIDIDRYAGGNRPPRTDGRKRLALYGRPEVARNMFATAIESLARFVQDKGLTPDDIDLVSIGLAHAPVKLPGGHVLHSLGKLPWEDYPDYLLGVDLGLSLMYSPHPSHPPLEMAASGVRVVTNSFGPKNLSRLSPAILSVPATARDLAAALGRAWDMNPVSPQARAIDLGQLGLDQPVLIDRLAADLSRSLPFDTVTPPAPARTRRIILHVGSPKCGSTYLQRVLLQNRDLLLKHGIRYPHDGGAHPGNAADLAALTRDRLDSWFAGDVHTVVLSHEDLYSVALRGSALARLVAEDGTKVEILTFLRPFSEFVYGDYSQFMKQNFKTWLDSRAPYDGKDFETFSRRRVDTLTPAKFLTDWQKRFSGAPLTLASHRDIRPTLERLLPLPDDALEAFDWTVARRDTNPSLRVADCDRIAAAMRDPDTNDDAIRALLQEAAANSASPDPGRTPERTAAIETLFADQTALLMERFGFDNRLEREG